MFLIRLQRRPLRRLKRRNRETSPLRRRVLHQTPPQLLVHRPRNRQSLRQNRRPRLHQLGKPKLLRGRLNRSLFLRNRLQSQRNIQLRRHDLKSRHTNTSRGIKKYSRPFGVECPSGRISVDQKGQANFPLATALMSRKGKVRPLFNTPHRDRIGEALLIATIG
jgi:hypothetical protein